MKRLFITLCGILILCATAYATDLARTPSSLQFGGQPIQFFAPDGTTTTTLAVTSTTVDLSNYILFRLESGSGTTCNVRMMPTSAKGAYKQQVFRVAGTVVIQGKNMATPFVNFSGCTAGSYSLQ